MKLAATLKLAKLSSAFVVLGLANMALANPTIQLRVIETTDIHAYYTAYDYFKDAPVQNYGLTRTATLIKQARAEVPNYVLVDNGDLIQGGIIGNWALNDNFQSYQIHPAYQAFQYLKYDVSNLGNHEFNFGLPYLNKVVETAQTLAQVPVINANVYDAKTGKNYFTPYVIQDKEVVDSEGNKHTIKVGYIGFTPPTIMQWDADKLVGHVTTAPIVETAQKFIPEMKAKGAQVIIAIPHSGIGVVSPSNSLYENQVINLTKVPGIDAVVFGHSHAVYPSAEFKDVKGADIERGLINGVPSVMPGRWGDHLGIVDLVLVQDEQGNWKVDSNKSVAFTRAIYDGKNRKALVEEDPGLVAVLENTHKATREYANAPIGQLSNNLYGYLALTQDDYAVKLVNQVQLATLQKWAGEQGNTYQNYRLLSTQAPFKYGERHNDVTNFVAVDKGTFALRNVSDVYVYPNTFNVVKLTGAELKGWLECATGQFNQIDPNNTERQDLINYQTYRTYNYDVFYGVTYQIDVTKPAKYTSTCKPTGVEGAGRIVNLKYTDGSEVKDSDNILVATNNYRANGGRMPGTGADHIVYAGLSTSQEIIMDYVSEISKQGTPVSIDTNPSWSFLPIPNGEQLNVVIYSAPDDKAVNWTLQNSVWPLTKLGLDNAGFQEYRIDLSKYQPQNLINNHNK
ncbi:bifunctional 2',3'-cyclic-nucleotide 2'-phosphodiesterase/3'-nucleotidase [Psittacicella gerlachiana]|uniref:2',3'-cyclic-nucleotide 2'-phosphodiesterase n=1 Tax=Psittacicella gerlachiana TaxID=2028574 RepID=A0A3A1YQL2_9GAMM|nr:bifunctional 2',3'-cyclic-nucleotide 2'-phosphodiesterase/3'-nucleotidase [Psittacicella gerlachiana]RIY38654.1 2',3'-cyclic-nucleotide 2'-phosphodiesterase [Psittacicella gerlachiana]